MIIIDTKLHIPRPRVPIIERDDLIRRLDEGLNYELTLITAPAGYGKTTLLSEWTMTLHQPVAWLSLDQRDNDPARFWGHTIAALKQAYHEFDEQFVVRHIAEDITGDSLIAALINELHHISQTVIMIWDDFHMISDPTIRNSVVYLLERLPSHVHFYIASRIPPSLSLSRLRVKNALNRLEADDLCFKQQEITQFFVKHCGMLLSNREIAIIQERTEGWPTAMRLAVMALPEQADSDALIQKVTGTERDISNYFFEEVFSRQSDTVQQFLMQTSILERMTNELCHAVTDIITSETNLQQLEENSLFLISLDEHQEWYRYHHLFQTFLVKQLKKSQPLEWEKLHIRAGKWLEDNGYPQEAVEHYLASSSFEYALTLLEKLVPDLMFKEWKTLGDWLHAIPNKLLFTKPMMLLTKLAAQYLSGQIETATEGYWQVMHTLKESETSLPLKVRQTLQAGLPFLSAFRLFLDRNYEGAIQYSREYTKIHPKGDLFVGFGSDRDGYHPVWDIYVSDDSLLLADQIVTTMLSIWSETENAPFIAHLHIDFGKLLYERNHLNEAKRYMQQAYQFGKQCNNVSLMVIAELWLARIAAVQGKWNVADEIIMELEKQTSEMMNPHLFRKVVLFQAILGKLKDSKQWQKHWLKRSGLSDTDEIPVSMVEEYRLLAMIQAGQGQQERANMLIERLLHIVNKAGRRQGERIRLLIAKSIVFSLQGKVGQSMKTLEEALAIAYPENYMRIFVDEGTTFGMLLAQYIKFRQSQQYRPIKKVPLPYVKQLQNLIFPFDQASESAILINGYKPSLTLKEQEVLKLMEIGLTNKEMADKLGVSLSTIKTHINNMYSKLQVKNRLQALERARAYKLL